MNDIQAFIFDVFGTVVDWRTTIVEELRVQGDRCGASAIDWDEFAGDWRSAFWVATNEIAAGGDGPRSIDALHRKLLDTMLESEKWADLGKLWDDEHRTILTMAWHRLRAFPDSSKGLHALKKSKIIAVLSNGNMRSLIDLAKHSNLPWDAVLSTELFDTYKPNPKVYRGAAYHLSLEPSQCAMVAAHGFDVKSAASNGMKTVYVRRGEDPLSMEVKSKKDGGEFDLVVGSIEEIAGLFAK
ncbi:hypothetical protein CCMSSC00406_0009613 [Pleurotus cornucopiae]|uniref:Uncharacterized protein n=1 Tax=Pleurotus cornucopiae TaxID=5321 RepID=A0ACB7IPS4_PLECO|nr:hypothetical protein CCMSSC00406_0009613 [Pleurotus cornucopiae]